MWLSWLCLVTIANGAFGNEPFLSYLYGLHGRNKIIVCLKIPERQTGRECEGALLQSMLVGVRAGCLRQHSPLQTFALRPINGESCDVITHEYSSSQSRGVQGLYYHPWADLAVVHLTRPYFDLDVHPNSTSSAVKRAFKEYGTWVWTKKHIQAARIQRDVKLHYRLLYRKMRATSSPLTLFLLTILLPLVSLVAVFFFVIHCTGNEEEIHYKTLQYTY